jgi:hypothetical protein
MSFVDATMSLVEAPAVTEGRSLISRDRERRREAAMLLGKKIAAIAAISAAVLAAHELAACELADRHDHVAKIPVREAHRVERTSKVEKPQPNWFQQLFLVPKAMPMPSRRIILQ